MEIMLIRHGKPAFELKGKFRANEIHNIVQHYNASGIIDTPSATTMKLASGYNTVICSDLKRALHSAQALGFNDVYLSDTLFREVAIPYFKQGAIKLPLEVWVVFLRGLSIFGFSENGESLSMAKQRAKWAAAKLIDIAHYHNNIMFVGHGFINYLIVKELLSNDWTGPSKPGKNYWDYGIYRYEETNKIFT